MSANQMVPEDIIPAPPPNVQSSERRYELPWRPARTYPRMKGTSAQFDMTTFSRWLIDSEIVDDKIKSAPGGLVVLPWGKMIIDRFCDLVARSARKIEFEEYQFPILASSEIYERSADLADLETALLKTKSGTARRSFVLGPTGEQTIYSFWADRLRKDVDFPARIFQRTRYFRPATRHRLTGGGVYKSVEAGDVIEFHGAHATRDAAIGDANRLCTLFQEIGNRIGVAMVWTTRPPWSNKGNLYEWAIGGDALLPHGVSVQVASSYFQGQVFSSRYRVGVRKNGHFDPAWIADGVISRRMVFACLQQSLINSPAGYVPYELAPYQAVVLTTGLSTGEGEQVATMVANTQSLGFRVRLECANNREEFRILNTRWRSRKVPLRVLIFHRTSGATAAILCRSDDGRECDIQDLERTGEFLCDALRDFQRTTANQVCQTLASRSVKVTTEDGLQLAITSGLAAIGPMVPTCQNTSRIHQLQSGEILGFFRDESPALCILSGQLTRIRAIVSRRL